jgi:hypothetical protein
MKFARLDDQNFSNCTFRFCQVYYDELRCVVFCCNRLTFSEVLRKKRDSAGSDEVKSVKVITVQPHVIPSRGPYLFNEPKK